MKTYVKKPIKIQAFEWDGNIDDIRSNVDKKDWNKFVINDGLRTKLSMIPFTGGEVKLIGIETLEGILTASKGDYIIRGIKGEYYSCKPDVFKDTYDEVIKDED